MPYKKCNLCARGCSVNRENGELGYCKMSSAPVVARAALHRWEEPIISGSAGSGTIFFSGCSLGCVFCQNASISGGKSGIRVTDERISDMMLELQKKGAHNVNFVTPTHFIPSVRNAIIRAREKGLKIPIVYNTGSYDSVEALEMLDGLVDVYLPDFKYYRGETAKEYSRASDYPNIAKAAISEMLRQRGMAVIEDGLIKSGVVVRVLLLPEHVAEAKLTVKYLYETYGDGIYVSLMSQYTPMPGQKPPLDRRVSHAEYDELVEYALKKGVKNAFTQDFGCAEESFIPDFDNTGVLK